MFNIFEQPWTLLIAAVFVVLLILIIRIIFPSKRHWRQFLIPALLASAAFGLDFFVKTDLEKINSIIKTVIKAVEEEDANTLVTLLSPSYHDSFHNTKDDLMSYCRVLFSEPLVARNIKTDSLLKISSPAATAILVVLTEFDKQSYMYEYKVYQFTKVKLYLEKGRDRNWLINQIEILEIDRKPLKWKHIR